MNELKAIQTWWLRGMIQQMKDWQDKAKASHDASQDADIALESQNLYSSWLNATDDKVKQQCLSSSNCNNISLAIKQAAKDHWSTAYDWLWVSESISRYMDKNPQFEDITNQAINGKVSLDEWAKSVWAYVDESQNYDELYESYVPTGDVSNWKSILWVWTAWIGTLWLWTRWVSELLDRWLNMYWWSFDMNENEASNIQRDNANKLELRKYDNAIKEQEKVLEKAIKDNVWIEEAQAKLDYLKSSREKIENNLQTTTRKTVDTAYDYGLKWRSKAEIWDKARAAWEYMFNTEIVPALQNSTQTVNIQELINNINVEDLAKWDPMKREAYSDALEALKEAYSDPKYAEYSMMDTQTLKSWIQGRTPQKFYKWKEITNELQELNWILGSKIKNELHAKLSSELGENTAKKYLDYSNLMDIAKAWVKDRAASKSKGGFGGFQNWVKDKIVTPLSSKWWYRARQVREFFESIPSKISSSTKNLLEEIKANPKSVLKKWWKWVKELLKMDALMFAPDYKEIFENSKDEISLSLIKDRLNWEWLFKWKTDEEMEEMMSMQSIMEKLQDKDFLQYLYNQWIDIDELEELLTNINE